MKFNFMVVFLGLLSAISLTSISSALEFKDVKGEWIIDHEYSQKLYRAEKGEKYNESEWNKTMRFCGSDELRLDDKTIAFYEHGQEKYSYPVTKIETTDGIVWVHMGSSSGMSQKRGFLLDGTNLKMLRSSKNWDTCHGYKRKEKSSKN